MTRKEAERQEAIELLREWVKPGDTIFCVLRSVSRSGMSRVIDLIKTDGEGVTSLGWNAARALGWGYDDKREGVKVGGCGMDMGFHLVNNLSATLFPNGFMCIGDSDSPSKRCPAADHFNGDRDYTPHLHEKHQGAYALRHRWL